MFTAVSFIDGELELHVDGNCEKLMSLPVQPSTANPFRATLFLIVAK